MTTEGVAKGSAPLQLGSDGPHGSRSAREVVREPKSSDLDSSRSELVLMQRSHEVGIRVQLMMWMYMVEDIDIETDN